MPHFYIEANATPMGEYQAPTKMQALNAYAHEAGYDSYIDMLCQLSGDSPIMKEGEEMVREIDTDTLVHDVEQKTGLACCQPSFDGVVQQGGTVFATWGLFAEANGFLIQDFLN